jgi:hypothetical protein
VAVATQVPQRLLSLFARRGLLSGNDGR